MARPSFVSSSSPSNESQSSPEPEPAPAPEPMRQPSSMGLGTVGRGEGQDSVVEVEGGLKHRNNLNQGFTFTSFVEGKSNQLGLAASQIGRASWREVEGSES